MTEENLSEDDINNKGFSTIDSNMELVVKDKKGDLSEDEEIIINKVFFGNLIPRAGCVYSVSFTEYDKTQSIFRGFMIHFDHEIKMRAADTNSSNRRFNFNDIKLAPKTYNVKYDSDFFVSKKEKFNDHICIIEDVKKIKTRLVKFFRIEERSISIIDFWDKYIQPIAGSYLVDGIKSFDDKLNMNNSENSNTVLEKSGDYSKDNSINSNISVIKYLEGKFTDDIFIDFIKFLNKKIDNDKLHNLEMSTSILDLSEIKANITNCLEGIKKKSVTYVKSEAGIAITKFKIIGKENELEKFKENMITLDKTSSFLNVC